MKNHERPLLLTAEAAAHELSIGRSQMYKLMQSGEVPYVHIGGSRRIRASDIDAYVERISQRPMVMTPRLS